MQTKKLQMDISKAMSICLRHGVTVYPVVSGRMFKIEVNDNNKLKRYTKEIGPKEISKAQSDTYKYHAIKILNDKNNAV